MKAIILFLSLLINSFGESFIQPLEPIHTINKEKAMLGKILFFDTSLSNDATISCASCHKAEYGWADNQVVSTGVYGRKGIINSPTVLNAVYNFKQFWNGRVDNLEEQAKGPIHTSFEMDMDEKKLENRLNKNSMYKNYFQKIYNVTSIKFHHIINAIAEYEKTLTTQDSKFDLYLKGKNQLNDKEMQGYKLFKMYGCITCHNGMNIGGNSFQKIGIVIPYKNCYKDRYEITNKKFDQCVYKVPTLRNIAKTAPYFHDGSAKTLRDAIKAMAYYNLGFDLQEQDIIKIEAFLHTLNAPLQEEY